MIDDESQYQAMAVLTLRDYFAAKAMQSILFHLAKGIRPRDCIKLAEDSYFVADAMLKAREVQS
jgi:hypothetical protein